LSNPLSVDSIEGLVVTDDRPGNLLPAPWGFPNSPACARSSVARKVKYIGIPKAAIRWSRRKWTAS